jgi:hypothetical protein
MTRLENHLHKYREFKRAAEASDSDAVRVETWFLAAYHLIEACAAKHRVHIQKHQRVPEELLHNPSILGGRTKEVVDAFRFLDFEARAKFVYGTTGSRSDLARARGSFETIEAACREVLD